MNGLEGEQQRFRVADDREQGINVLLVLIGLYALLFVPFLASGIEHLFIHLFIHWFQHHEDAVAVVAPACLWLLLFSLPLLLLVFGF